MIDRGFICLFLCLFVFNLSSVGAAAGKAHFKRWVSFRAAAARLLRVGLVDNSASLVWKWNDNGSRDGDSASLFKYHSVLMSHQDRKSFNALDLRSEISVPRVRFVLLSINYSWSAVTEAPFQNCSKFVSPKARTFRLPRSDGSVLALLVSRGR